MGKSITIATTWFNSELVVLKAFVGRFQAVGDDTMTATQGSEETELPKEAVEKAFRLLECANPPYFQSRPEPDSIKGPTERALVVTGAWPEDDKRQEPPVPYVV